MSAEENKALVRRFTEEIWNRGNLDAIEEFVAENYDRHDPANPEVAGREGFIELVAAVRGALPDLRLTIDDMLAEGDKVVTRYTMSGTHQGEFQGIPPTGRQVTMTGISILRINNGQAVEAWNNADQLGFLQQLGAIPAPGQTGR